MSESIQYLLSWTSIWCQYLVMTDFVEHDSTPVMIFCPNSCFLHSAWINQRNLSVEELCLNHQLQPSIWCFIQMIRYISTCFFAVNTLFASTQLTTECDFSQGAESSSANHIGFQLHCYVGTVYELFWSINLHYVVIWVSEPNISAVCPLSSSSLCFVYCHGWLCGACPVAWLNRYHTVCVKIIRGEERIKESTASRAEQHVGDRPPGPLHS